ncbi:DNA-processing protein DprA [Polynucleobacter necessarius]|uniref:DNA-processing protein DprA n=1 Tax=Polynucleobacter necessarius TaxID=576610 RepID=UPI0018D58B50
MPTSLAPKSPIHISRESAHYPSRLRDLYDLPNSLYIYKENLGLLKIPMIAVVGSRNASPEGLKNARLFARALSKAGALIISGLAKGG